MCRGRSRCISAPASWCCLPAEHVPPRCNLWLPQSISLMSMCPPTDIVKKYGSSIAVAAKDWVDRYRESRGAATAELLTFLLQVGPGSA